MEVVDSSSTTPTIFFKPFFAKTTDGKPVLLSVDFFPGKLKPNTTDPDTVLKMLDVFVETDPDGRIKEIISVLKSPARTCVREDQSGRSS